MTISHLATPETQAKAAAARKANYGAARPTTRPGSETTNLAVGDPVVIRTMARSAVSRRYNGRKAWIATVNAQTFPNGNTYVELGVSWCVRSDWTKASADAWFRNDELKSLNTT